MPSAHRARRRRLRERGRPESGEARSADPTDLLALEEAVELATALAQEVARRADIRILVLKGPLAGSLGLRPRRPSQDVDVLADPTRAGQLVERLSGQGWTPRPSPGFPTILAPHSRTLTHPGWPVDIDVHSNWPGFLVDAPAAFEALWARRRSAVLAGRAVETTGEADSALVLALHSLREAGHLTIRDRRIFEYEFLLRALRERPELTPLIHEAALSTGSTQTALPFLRALGVEIAPGPSPDDDALRQWHLHSAARHVVSGWIDELSRAPLHRKALIAWHGLFPSPRELRAIDPGIGRGPLEVARGWWRRTRRGIRTIPGAVEDVRRFEERAAGRHRPGARS